MGRLVTTPVTHDCEQETVMTTTTLPTPPSTASPAAVRLGHVRHTVAVRLAEHSVGWLRISLGLIITAFGALKSVPGASPAEAW